MNYGEIEAIIFTFIETTNVFLFLCKCKSSVSAMNVNAIILETVQFLPHIRYYSLLLARSARLVYVCFE